MSQRDTDGIEKSLESLRPRDAPPGLKSTVLAAARESRMTIGMTPRLWRVTAVCSVLLMVTLWGDAVVSQSQAQLFRSLLGRPAITQAAGGELLSLPAEMDEVFSVFESPRLARDLIFRMGRGSESEGDSIEILKRLKGKMDEQIEENYY